MSIGDCHPVVYNCLHSIGNNVHPTSRCPPHWAASGQFMLLAIFHTLSTLLQCMPPGWTRCQGQHVAETMQTIVYCRVKITCAQRSDVVLVIESPLSYGIHVLPYYRTSLPLLFGSNILLHCQPQTIPSVSSLFHGFSSSLLQSPCTIIE